MRCVPLLVLAACLLFPAPVAFADDAPDYTSEALIFVQGDLPAGWKVLDSDACPPELPNEDQVTGAGGDAVDTFEITVEYRLLEGPAGAKAVVAIADADLDDGPAVYRKGLEAIASLRGGKVSELGHPQRLMLVVAPSEHLDALVAWQRRVAAKKLVALAYDRLLSDFAMGKPGKLSMVRADEYADAALALQQKMPAAQVIHGMVEVLREDEEAGIPRLRAGLAATGELGATPRMRYFGWGLIGRALINDTKKKPATPQENQDAVQAFRKALETEAAAIAEANERNDQALRIRLWGTRYNLSCGLVRIKKKAAAYKELELCMTLGRRMLSLGGKWQMWFEHAWFWDEDLQPLRSEKRFMDLMKKFAPENYDWAKRRAELEKLKQKREEEKAKREAAEKHKKDKEGNEKGGGA